MIPKKHRIWRKTETLGKLLWALKTPVWIIPQINRSVERIKKKQPNILGHTHKRMEQASLLSATCLYEGHYYMSSRTLCKDTSNVNDGSLFLFLTIWNYIQYLSEAKLFSYVFRKFNINHSMILKIIVLITHFLPKKVLSGKHCKLLTAK